MTKLTHFGMVGIFALVTLGVAACGSDGPPATAEPGSKFCDLAQEARDIGDEVDPNSADPDQLEEQVDDALTASKAAAAAAPKDFEDIAEESVETQEAFVDLLEDYDYEFIAAVTSDEGVELLEDPRFAEIEDERDDYLEDKCEIEPTEDTLGGDISLNSGEDGIRELLGLLQLGADSEVTDEQVECAVEALSGNISDEDVAAIANSGTISDAGQVVFAQALTDCGIVVTGG